MGSDALAVSASRDDGVAMNRYFYIAVILVMLCLTNVAQAVDQSANNLVRSRIKEDAGAYSQWNYGNQEWQIMHGLDKADTYTATGGVYQISVDETELNGALIPGVGITSVWTDEPITGTGVAGNAVTISGVKGDITATGGSATISINDDAVDDTDIDFGTGAGQASASDLPNEDLGDVSIATGVFTVDPDSVLLNEIGDPGADSSITMANKIIDFLFTTPTGGMHLHVTGAGASHIFEVEQNTGNPGSGTHLAHFEADDPDVVPLHINHDGASAVAGSDVYGLVIDSQDDNDTDWVPILIQDDAAVSADTIFKIASDGTLITSGGTMTMQEMAASRGDTAAYGQVWVKTATPNQLWFTDDTGGDWQIGPIPIGGSDTHVQYNNGGVLGGEADFVWDDTNKQLLLGAPAATAVNIQLIGDGLASFVGSIYSGDDLHAGATGIAGTENEGALWLYDGDGEALALKAIDIAADKELDLSAIGGWTDDYLVSIDTSPLGGPAFAAIDPAPYLVDTDTNITTKAVTVESPTASEDITLFFTPDAITIDKMASVLLGSSTPSVTYTVRFGSDRSAAGTEVVTSGTASTSVSTGDIVTSFNDATIPADSWVWLETTAKSGIVASFALTIRYSID